MINTRDDQFLWVEKYRPQTISECILPGALKDTLHQFVAAGELPTLMFTGTAGVGKTTVAKALCNEIGAEYILINGSDEGRMIDTLRVKIKGFASTVSLTDAKKVVILDEADYAGDIIQQALRGFIEEFSNNCRFIFTCNYKNRIIQPLHSRCSVIDFKIDNKDKQIIAAGFFKRVSQILNQEQIEFDPKVVAELITQHFPDYRRILNELQRYSVSGTIDSGILISMSDESIKELMSLLKAKSFNGVRKWVAKNSETDSTHLFHLLYTSTDYLEAKSTPELVLILADYQHRAAFVADHELNIMAALTEIMRACSFK